MDFEEEDTTVGKKVVKVGEVMEKVAEVVFEVHFQVHLVDLKAEVGKTDKAEKVVHKAVDDLEA